MAGDQEQHQHGHQRNDQQTYCRKQVQSGFAEHFFKICLCQIDTDGKHGNRRIQPGYVTDTFADQRRHGQACEKEKQTDNDGENITIDVFGIRRHLKQPSSEVVFVPIEMVESKPLSGMTNADKKILNKYTTPVDPSFYNEIQIEDVNRAAEEIQKHTEKPKKRRL